MVNNKNLLLIFTRNPELGKVKKRLAKKIGEKPALDIYLFLLEHTARITKNLPFDKQVWYSEEIEKDDFWEGSIYDKKLQTGGGLGERMENAFRQGFAAGAKHIIIIGSDLFEISQKDLEKAFSALERAAYVIGPAEDGGYYLLGMKSLNSALFKEKSWGTATVFEETLKNIENQHITILERRNDIDVFEDIKDHPVFQKFIN